MIKCGVCNKPAGTDNVDVMPTGWYIIYAYDNDDGNNIKPYEVCGSACLKIAAFKQREEIFGNRMKEKFK